MEQELILSVCIGVVFLLVKLIAIRMNHQLDITEKTSQQRSSFRDSIMVSFIVAIGLFVHKEFFSKNGLKTRVFTNEPGF